MPSMKTDSFGHFLQDVKWKMRNLHSVSVAHTRRGGNQVGPKWAFVPFAQNK